MKRKGIADKIKTSIEIIKNFKNWETFFLDHFGLIKDEEVVYKLRNGLKFITRTDSLDKWMIKEIFIDKPYHPIEISKGDKIVDIGAHIGTFSLLAGMKTGSDGKVYAYEPEPDTFELLKRNISINSLSNVVHAYNLGISKDKGKKKLHVCTRENRVISYLSSFYQEHARSIINARIAKTIEVGCITLRDIFESNHLDRINVLKMDCEGEEYKILFSTQKKYIAKIDKICMEYHDHLSSHYTHKDLMNLLSTSGFEVLHVIPMGSIPHCGMIYGWNRKY